MTTYDICYSCKNCGGASMIIPELDDTLHVKYCRVSGTIITPQTVNHVALVGCRSRDPPLIGLWEGCDK